jgi:hypothetical protein
MGSEEYAFQLDDDNVEVRTKPCWICGQVSLVRMPEVAWGNYYGRDIHLDTAWPEGSVADRTLIATGVHTKCWDEEFPDNDNKERTNG